MSRGLDNPTLIVNGIAIAIKPNSGVIRDGEGEYTVRTASAGGAKVEMVFTRNIETARGMVKFSLYTTVSNANSVKEWKLNQDTNVVQAVAPNFSRTFNNATMINDPDINMGHEGEIEVEFESDSAV